MSYKLYLYIMYALVGLAVIMRSITYFECMTLLFLLQVVDELKNLVAFKKKEDATLERLMKNAKKVSEETSRR